MAMYQQLVFAAFLCLLPYLGAGDTCLSPDVKHEVYTTTEATMSTDTAVILEFSVVCKNNLKNLNLYVEFSGRILPAARVTGSEKYQVSFTDEHKNIPSGSYSARVFDEEGFSDYRKAQRNNEDTSAIKKLFTINFHHEGASTGPMVQSELAALSLASLVFYFAYTARYKLQA